MLCYFSHQFPPFVANFLQRGRTLRRRFREESVTDLLMGSLVALGGGRLVVEFPDESMTGADMEWNFVNPDDGTFFRLLIQAKQLYGDGAIWTRHNYRELFYAPSGKLQVQVLCDTARSQVATHPLYILYHPERSCTLAQRAGARNVEGITLVDGYWIETLAKSANTRLLRTRYKSLGTLHPTMLPLATLFCPSAVVPMPIMARAPIAMSTPMVVSFAQGRPPGISVPPRPEDVRQRVIALRSSFITGAEEIVGHSLDLAEVPAVSDVIPEEVQAIVDWRRGRGEAPSPPRHWRVTFISAGRKDDDGRRSDLLGSAESRNGQ